MILADLILLIHLLMAIYLAFLPFCTSTLRHLQLHLMCLMCILVHWYVNDNTCALTLLEKHLRKLAGQPVRSKDTFFGRIFNPVYKVPDEWYVFLFIQFTVLCCIRHQSKYCTQCLK